VASHYDAIVAMDLTDGEDRAGRLGSTLDFGPSTFMLECTLNRDACDQLFLDGDGKPLREDHYERIARDAFLALIPRDAPDRAFRRVPLERQSLWVRMRALGPASLSRALPPDLAADRLRVEVVVADYTTIVWWAQAMARAAAALVEARQFLANRGPAGPGDSAFAKVRERLEESLARVVVTTEARWGDPWDVLALDAASNRRATVRAVIVSPALSMAYDERRVAARGTLPKRRSKITERGSPRRRRRPSHAERRAGPRVGTRRRTRGGRGRKR
jgi:hypothetical protein